MKRENQQEVLHGGREGKITRLDNLVIRPGNRWTPHVHRFLSFMHENGMGHIPLPLGINEEGMETVSFVDGIVYNDTLPDQILTDEILAAVAKLLRRYHDIGMQYVSQLTGNEVWMLPGRMPAEVMCHGDFAPYNITFVDGHVHGIIDFDTLHPGPRIWDIAYAVYRWIPFVSPSNPDYRGDLEQQLRRLRLFADAYGLEANERKQLPCMMLERLQALVAHMRRQAAEADEDVLANIEDGHMKLYLNDIQYIADAQDKIMHAMM